MTEVDSAPITDSMGISEVAKSGTTGGSFVIEEVCRRKIDAPTAGNPRVRSL